MSTLTEATGSNRGFPIDLIISIFTLSNDFISSNIYRWTRQFGGIRRCVILSILAASDKNNKITSNMISFNSSVIPRQGSWAIDPFRFELSQSADTAWVND
jgi:hypothetical protein